MFKNRKIFVLTAFTVGVFGLFGGVAVYAGDAGTQDINTCNGLIQGYSCNKEGTPPYPGAVSESCMPSDEEHNNFMNPLPTEGFIFDFFNGFGGWIKGHDNVNAGTTEFNTHPLSGFYSHDPIGEPYYADLGIVSEGTFGFAPQHQGLEACLDGSGHDLGAEIEGEFFPLKGYAWNTNLGFISFYCNAGKNLGWDCGPYNYEVDLLPDSDLDGVRELTGHAWNPTFGYISFSGDILSGESLSKFKTSLSYLSLIGPYGTGTYNNGFAYVFGGSEGIEVVTSDGQEINGVDGGKSFGWAALDIIPDSGPQNDIARTAAEVESMVCTATDKIGEGKFPVPCHLASHQDGSLEALLDNDPSTGANPAHWPLWPIDSHLHDPSEFINPYEDHYDDHPTAITINLKSPQTIKSLTIEHPNKGGVQPTNYLKNARVEFKVGGQWYFLDSSKNLTVSTNTDANTILNSNGRVVTIDGLEIENASAIKITVFDTVSNDAGWWIDEISWTYPAPISQPNVGHFTLLYDTSRFLTEESLETYLSGINSSLTFDVRYFEGGNGSVYPKSGQNPVLDYEFGTVLPGAIVLSQNEGYLMRTVTSGGDSYGVKAHFGDDGWWYLTGWVYTNAGVYMNFDGVRLSLPVSTEGCSDARGVCIDVMPNPRDRSFKYSYKFNEDEDLLPPIANGEDGYRLVVFLKDQNGEEIMLDDGAGKIFKVDEIQWQDTVKADQTKNALMTFNDKESPWENGGDGGVLYKPLSLPDLKDGEYAEDSDCLSYTGSKDWCRQNFGEDGDDNYGYVYTKNITSYAPTSNANVSATTSTKPSYLVRNEEFLTDSSYGSADKKSININNGNNLILKNLKWALEVPENEPVTGNSNFGTLGLSLNFRPAIYLDHLYSYNDGDSLIEFAGLPIPFKIGLEEATGGTGSVAAGFKDMIKESLKLDMYLNYARDAVVDMCGDKNDNLVISFQSGDHPPHVFNESEQSHATLALPGAEGKRTVTVTVPGTADDDVEPYEQEQTETLTPIDDIDDLFGSVFSGFLTMFNFPEIIPDGQTLCQYFTGGTLYSVISYSPDENGEISYYSNKLPRLFDDLHDSGAFISGNVYSPYAKGTTSNVVSPLYSKSDKILNTIRDTISKNVKKEFANTEACKDSISANVKDLFTSDTDNKGADSCGKVIDTLNGGNDVVAYYSAPEVHLVAGDDDFNSEKTYVLIIDGGNVYIDTDLTKSNTPENLIIVSLGSGSLTGNVFVKYNVKNIMGTVFADGAVVAYAQKTADADPNSASVSFKMTELLEKIDNYKKSGGSAPNEFLAEQISELLDVLKTNSAQLNWEGGIASKNTIGGASIDVLQEYGKYFGRGNLPEKDRSVAQLFDLNYLRFFKLRLELCPQTEPQGNNALDCYVPVYDPEGNQTSEYDWVGGLPIDQQCKKGLTNEMIVRINEGAQPKVENKYTNAECNGIDPVNPVNQGGDLVPFVSPGDQAKFADGLYNVENGDMCALREDGGSDLGGGVCTGWTPPEGCGECQYGPVYIQFKDAPESFLLK